MASPALIGAVLSFAVVGYYAYCYYVLSQPEVSGDGFYMRRMAFTDKPVSPPYCWRPLHAFMARIAGFRALAVSSSLATCAVVYGYAGGGWTGLAVLAAFLGTQQIIAFNILCPEYGESTGHLWFILSLWLLSLGSPWAVLPMIAAMITRESLGATLMLVSLFSLPWAAVPVAAAGAAAYFFRREDRVNRHPLVEAGAVATLRRWLTVKKGAAFHYAHTVQSLRGVPWVVPFGWGGVSAHGHALLLGFVPLFLFGLPASGQSRQLAYGFGLLIPFLAAVPAEWQWLVAGTCWFWPTGNIAVFDESGGESFGHTA